MTNVLCPWLKSYFVGKPHAAVCVINNCKTCSPPSLWLHCQDCKVLSHDCLRSPIAIRYNIFHPPNRHPLALQASSSSWFLCSGRVRTGSLPKSKIVIFCFCMPCKDLRRLTYFDFVAACSKRFAWAESSGKIAKPDLRLLLAAWALRHHDASSADLLCSKRHDCMEVVSQQWRQ